MATIAFIGGTGPEGMGLAQRFARAGHAVVIGSRDVARASEAAAALREAVPGADVRGALNAEAAAAASIAFVVVPYAGQRDTLAALRAELAGKLVIDAVVPMAFRDGVARALVVEEGSATQQAAALLPESRVAGAFHHLSARKLSDGDTPLDADCLVVGDDPEAKAAVFALVREIAGLRPIDAGPLAAAYPVEVFTAALVSINKVHKTQAGVRIAGVG